MKKIEHIDIICEDSVNEESINKGTIEIIICSSEEEEEKHINKKIKYNNKIPDDYFNKIKKQYLKSITRIKYEKKILLKPIEDIILSEDNIWSFHSYSPYEPEDLKLSVYNNKKLDRVVAIVLYLLKDNNITYQMIIYLTKRIYLKEKDSARRLIMCSNGNIDLEIDDEYIAKNI